MPKKIIITSIIVILLIIGAVFAAVKYFPAKLSSPKVPFTTTPAVTTSTKNVSFALKSTTASVKAGDKAEISLYITGSDAAAVSGFDVKVNYDKTKLKLDKASQGTFFDDYLVAKWDTNSAWFAAVYNPAKKFSGVHLSSPVLTLEFSAVSKTISTQVSTSTNSMVVFTTDSSSYRPPSANTTISIN